LPGLIEKIHFRGVMTVKRLLFGIIFTLLVAAITDTSQARVKGQCSNCHTMHYSQHGGQLAEWGAGGPYKALTVNTCLGCHTNTEDGYLIIEIGFGAGKSEVPIVYNVKGPENDTGLAGGNFYWVEAPTGGDDRGHNVLGISEVDGALTQAPGGTRGCGPDCHQSLAKEQSIIPDLGSGCEGCHLSVAHHADDGDYVDGAKHVKSAPWYRFLSAAHIPPGIHGVEGIEHEKWNYDADKDSHNEYLGKPDVHMDNKADFYSLGNTMTAFCCGCHGVFHDENEKANGSGYWHRHPSDHVIPDSGEYAKAFGANGGTGTYNPNLPVARPDLSSGTPSGTVTPGTDIVMCLSCHRAHGSEHYKMMRWDYKGSPGGGEGGCSTCHTSKS
jgi:hypothetical protein